MNFEAIKGGSVSVHQAMKNAIMVLSKHHEMPAEVLPHPFLVVSCEVLAIMEREEVLSPLRARFACSGR